MIVLDSSALIEIVKGSGKGELLKNKVGNESLGITTISINETLVSAGKKEREVFEDVISSLKVLEFDQESAFKSLEIENSLKERGNLIGKIDILIASICLTNNASLATLDKDFEKIKNLEVINP